MTLTSKLFGRRLLFSSYPPPQYRITLALLIQAVIQGDTGYPAHVGWGEFMDTQSKETFQHFFFFFWGGVTLVSWVQRTQAWPSANYVRRLAFGQTGSYSVQPILLLAATIGPAGRSRVFFYWVRPASFMGGPNYTAPSCPTATVRLINNTETLVPQIHHLYHR